MFGLKRWPDFGAASGFYYSRFPEPKPAEKHQAIPRDQKVYYHRLGTSQKDDVLESADQLAPPNRIHFSSSASSRRVATLMPFTGRAVFVRPPTAASYAAVPPDWGLSLPCRLAALRCGR